MNVQSIVWSILGSCLLLGTLYSQNQNSNLDLESEALRLFTRKVPSIAGAMHAAIARRETFCGDINGDGREDVLVYFVLVPDDGGTAIVGRGLAICLQRKGAMELAGLFQPDYPFVIEKIEGQHIHIAKLNWTPQDGRRPSDKEALSLRWNGSTLEIIQ